MPAVIFGDVHGASSQLHTLRRRIVERFGADIDVYSVGDLIDRGPDSKGVLDVCVEWGVKGILGNHDLWLCDVLSGRRMTDFPYTKIMGGIATLRSYGLERGDPDNVGPAIRRTVPKEHKEWLIELPPYRFIEVAGQNYCLVHTGIPTWVTDQLRESAPGFPEGLVPEFMSKEATDSFFWTGPDPKCPEKVAKFESFVQVFGHSVHNQATDVPGHYIALDTGCGTRPPNLLSAVILHDDGRREIITVR